MSFFAPTQFVITLVFIAGSVPICIFCKSLLIITFLLKKKTYRTNIVHTIYFKHYISAKAAKLHYFGKNI